MKQVNNNFVQRALLKTFPPRLVNKEWNTKRKRYKKKCTGQMSLGGFFFLTFFCIYIYEVQKCFEKNIAPEKRTRAILKMKCVHSQNLREREPFTNKSQAPSYYYTVSRIGHEYLLNCIYVSHCVCVCVPWRKKVFFHQKRKMTSTHYGYARFWIIKKSLQWISSYINLTERFSFLWIDAFFFLLIEFSHSFSIYLFMIFLVQGKKKLWWDFRVRLSVRL